MIDRETCASACERLLAFLVVRVGGVAFCFRPGLASVALALIGFAMPILVGPAPAEAETVLDRVRERAASRAESQTEAEANERVDSAVDKTVDCVFNPIDCAKQAPTPESETPAPTPGVGAATGTGDTTQWYAEENGNRIGPMPRSDLDARVASGKLNASTLVWREGLAEWKAAGQLPELAEAFKKTPPPLPGKSGPPPLPASTQPASRRDGR